MEEIFNRFHFWRMTRIPLCCRVVVKVQCAESQSTVNSAETVNKNTTCSSACQQHQMLYQLFTCPAQLLLKKSPQNIYKFNILKSLCKNILKPVLSTAV